MTVAYLDVDDEITVAVARLRKVEDLRFVLVLPPGSRIATSRINFRLLAREGQERGVTAALVSGEAGVRALAISAGMPAYASVDEAEGALTDAGIDAARSGPRHDQGMARPGEGPVIGSVEGGVAARGALPGATDLPGGTGLGSTLADAPGSGQWSAGAPPGDARPLVAEARGGAPAGQGASVDLEQTRILPRSSIGSSRDSAAASPMTTTPIRTQGPAEIWPGSPAARSRRRPLRRSLRGLLFRLAIVGALLGGALYAAYLFLPTVTVAVRPFSSVAGPISVEVTADPSVAVPDPEAAVIPAERIDIPLSATDTFEATGREVTEDQATGTVRFTSENTLFEVPVPEGTRVSTAEGIAFETTQTVTIPKASFQSGPASEEVAVRAVEGGGDGNVAAGAMTQLPQPIAAQLITVTNVRPTSGGARLETSIITRADYDRALHDLDGRLDELLAAALVDPVNRPPGLTIFPATATRDRSRPDASAGDLDGQAADTFTLTAESRGTVLGVDEALVAEIAGGRLEASLAGDTRLFPDSVSTTVGGATVTGSVIVYQAMVRGERYVPLDAAQLVSAIRGRTVSEARVILDAYGSVEITPWPDFISAVPDDARRINLTVLEPQRAAP